MFIKKAFLVLALFALYACGDTTPKKTNVLNRKPPQNKTVKQNTASSVKPDQTVFKKPEQITRNNRQENVQREVIKPETPKYQPFQSENTDAATGTLAYRSPEWFLRKSDSLQKLYSRETYYKNIQTIVNQISAVPSTTNNPAVNTNQWYAAIDFNIRKPNFVVLHHTAQDSPEQTLFTFSLRRDNPSSAHYVIGRNGEVFQMLNDYVRSYHAGASKWGNITDMNSCSIGIEIDNNGRGEPYSDAQIASLIKLLTVLKKNYGIPQSNFIGHSDVAPGRKKDPSATFPWKKLADVGFGFWYDPFNLQTPPADFNALLALRVIGYDISNQAEAIGAFKLHYIQNDTSKTLTEYDKKVLYSIYKNF